MMGHKLQSLLNLSAVGALVLYHVVGRSEHHRGVGRTIAVEDAVHCPHSTGNRVAVDGLVDDMVVGHLRQLLFYDVYVFAVSIDIDMVLREYAAHSVVGLLQLSAPNTEEVDKLLRKAFAAIRPQASALSAGKNDTVGFFSLIHNIAKINFEAKCTY